MEIKRNLFFRFFAESDLAMAILDTEGFIIATNRHFELLMSSLSISPVSPREPVNPLEAENNLLPRSIRDILGSKQTSRYWASLSQLINREREDFDFEVSFNPGYVDNSNVHWYNIHSWLIEDYSGTSSASASADRTELAVGILIEDMSKIHEEEKRLIEDKQIAEKAMEAKTQFLANMSHEIRTPIQTIIGMTELLEDTALDHQQAEYSGQVKFSADVLLSLINDILDFSKIESGKMELEHVSFLLEQVIEQAVDMISLEAHKKGLEIATDIPKELNVIIRGDPNKLRQIIINLVKNAVKFTYNGGVTVSAKLTTLENKPALQVTVADTGIGVGKDAQKRLFTTFMQADISDTRRYGGSGLGLAISHNMVELMNGHIEMIPNKKGGSIFRFVVPVEFSGVDTPPLSSIDELKDINTLIIDDQEETQGIIQSYLRDLGCINVDTASSGINALDMMKKAAANGNPYGLCLVDMIMPEMDGWQLITEIHNDETINKADLILMVPRGLSNAEIKMDRMKWVKARINKPIKRRNLTETISAVLENMTELESIESAADAEPEALLNDSNKANLQDPKEGSGALVLIAEDHPVNQKLFAAIMEKLGFRVLVSEDGLNALEKAELYNPDFILMDIQMPRMNGYEAAEKLRERNYTKPIIALTASIFGDEEGKYLKSGINDILIKPFRQTDLEKIIKKWLTVMPESNPIIPVVEADTTQPDMFSNSEIFNLDDLYASFMGNDDIAYSLLQRFIDRTSKQIEDILVHQKTKDWETARREAHTIKGAALIMGGRELGKAAAELELVFKNQEKDKFKAAYTPLKEAFNRFKKITGEYIGSVQS